MNVVTRLFGADSYPVIGIHSERDNRGIFTLCRERPRSILNSGRNIYAHKASRPGIILELFPINTRNESGARMKEPASVKQPSPVGMERYGQKERRETDREMGMSSGLWDEYLLARI